MENNISNDEIIVDSNGKSEKKISSIYEFASIIVSSVLAVGIIFTLFFRISTVSGESMENTLHNGDQLIISAITTDIKYGDVVVTSQPNAYGKTLIKRVIAVGGQTVSFDEESKSVLVDGVEIEEPYIKEEMEFLLSMSKTYEVPEGKLFLMGDNRNNSADSRDQFIGLVDERYVVGRVIYRIGDKGLFNTNFKES